MPKKVCVCVSVPRAFKNVVLLCALACVYALVCATSIRKSVSVPRANFSYSIFQFYIRYNNNILSSSIHIFIGFSF